ncbi:MAG: hypothetical protein AB7S55_10580 [Thiomonas sp.]|jgi:hypothetical protein
MPLSLPATRAAWTQPKLAAVVLDELRQQNALALPLQRGLAHGSHALLDAVSLMVLQRHELADRLRLKAGLSYSSIIPGCACEADPTPMSELAEYVELQIDISKADASASLKLLDDQGTPI